VSGLPINLDDLIHARAVEDYRLEFKATWDERIKLSFVQTACAFANDLLHLNGGYIVLGLEAGVDGRLDLPPRGLDDLDLDLAQREIIGQCRRIDPEYVPHLFVEPLQGKTILIAWCPGGDNRPYRAPRRLAEGDRAYYVRQGSMTVEAQGDTLTQLLELAARVPFDDRRSQEARIEDVSPSLVRRFLANVRSDLASGGQYDDREIYRHLGLVARINGLEVPRNFALLFFNEEPHRFFPGARMEIAQFADDAGGDLIEEKSVRGPLPDQIRFALDYLDSLGSVLLRKQATRPEVERTVAYPYKAMEEALVNAVYHRSYENAPEPTKVCLYPDRLEIISYPGPVPGLEPVHLQAGGPLPPLPARNRRIGELLKRLRLAEGWRTGLPKIRRNMRENGSPEPRFDFDTARSYFRVTLPVHPRYLVLHALRESAHLWALGDKKTALAHLLRTFEQQPGSGAVVGQIVEYALAQDDFQTARQTLQHFHETEPKSEATQPYLRMSAALLDRGNEEEGRRVLDLAPQQGGSPAYLAELAILRKRAGDHGEAHRLFQDAFPDIQDDARFVHEFAQTKMRLAGASRDTAVRRRLNRESEELLRRALRLSDQPVRQAWCWFDLAKVLSWLRAPVKEIEDAFQRAIALQPQESRFTRAHRQWRNREGRPKGRTSTRR
jgi:ATP-dependent DNA helicase RecG